jgi:hypothetical protein
MRSLGLLLGSAKDASLGRLRCAAIVVQFRMRSAMRGILRLERRDFDDAALAELHNAEAKSVKCSVRPFRCCVIGCSNVRIKAIRGIWGNVIC